MKSHQFLALTAACVLAAYAGSFHAGMRPAPAHAQVLQPRTQDAYVVPNDGLRFVDDQNRVLAMFVNNQGAGQLVLFDSNRSASVVISAGHGAGRVLLSARADGGALQVGNDGGGGFELSNSGARSQLVMNDAQARQAVALSSSAGGRLELAGSEGAPQARLAEGRFSLFGRNTRPLVQLRASDGTGGEVLVTDADGLDAFAVAGRAVRLVKGKDTLWKAP